MTVRRRLSNTPHWPQVGVGQTPEDFYVQAKAQLGGQVSAVEDQALAAINGWTSDARDAVLSNLDPNLLPLVSTAVQGVQDVVNGGGLNPNTFAAVAGLVAGSIGGPVAAAVAGSMVTSLYAMGQAVLGVFKLFGLQAQVVSVYDPTFQTLMGWPKVDQIVPNGPKDLGDGSYANPGWQSVWNQTQQMAAAQVFQCRRFQGGPWYGDINADALKRFEAQLPKYLNSRSYRPSGHEVTPWCEMQLAPQDDFRQFFYRLFYQNLDFEYNASPIANVPPQELLAHAAQVWNVCHDSYTQTVYRADVPDYNHFVSTISAIMSGVFDQRPGMAPITINTGPLIQPTHRVIALHHVNAAASTSTTAPMLTTTKVVAGTAAVTGAAILGTAIYAAAKGQVVDAVLSRIWRSIKSAF